MAKNILICDDAAFMRMMIKDILTKNGYNVVGEAENGAKGIEKYNELKPDLVLIPLRRRSYCPWQAFHCICIQGNRRRYHEGII